MLLRPRQVSLNQQAVCRRLHVETLCDYALFWKTHAGNWSLITAVVLTASGPNKRRTLVNWSFSPVIRDVVNNSAHFTHGD